MHIATRQTRDADNTMLLSVGPNVDVNSRVGERMFYGVLDQNGRDNREGLIAHSYGRNEAGRCPDRNSFVRAFRSIDSHALVEHSVEIAASISRERCKSFVGE